MSSCSTSASPHCQVRTTDTTVFGNGGEEVFEVVEEGRFEIDDFRDVDEADLVIYGIRLLGPARHTGLEIDLAWTNVNWLREGRIYRAKSFTNHKEALEAAGLSE
jgi:hypothetical protein